MTIAIESWAPSYGSSFGADPDLPSDATVDESVESPTADWRPVDPAPTARPAPCVHVVDGVRRIDAMVWITDDAGATRAGLAASFAAGIVRCDTAAVVDRIEVRRGLFTTAGAEPLETRAGTYQPMTVAGDDLDSLDAGLQQRMRDLEIAVARDAPPADLLVVDGPLRERQDVPGAIGYVKSHRVIYLSAAANAVVAQLAAGQRTPVFVTQTSWSRFCWYLRLPGGSGHPWAGIVRCEASADLPLAEVRAIADRTCLTLPRFASAPHKDARAPQNLVPIGALERELRRRLGDPSYVERCLRVAARRVGRPDTTTA